MVATILHPRHFSIFLLGYQFDIHEQNTCFLGVSKKGHTQTADSCVAIGAVTSTFFPTHRTLGLAASTGGNSTNHQPPEMTTWDLKHLTGGYSLRCIRSIYYNMIYMHINILIYIYIIYIYILHIIHPIDTTYTFIWVTYVYIYIHWIYIYIHCIHVYIYIYYTCMYVMYVM